MYSMGMVLRFILITSLITLPLCAQASPFCVQVRGIFPDCSYVDAVQCRKRALQLSGLCVTNPAELTVPASGKRYCLVDSSRTFQCAYPDYASCDRDAEREGGVCVDSLMYGTQPDPYGQDPNRKY